MVGQVTRGALQTFLDPREALNSIVIRSGLYFKRITLVFLRVHCDGQR